MKKEITYLLGLILFIQSFIIITNPTSIHKNNLDIDFKIPMKILFGEITTRFAGGDGSSEDPFQVSNVTQLQYMNLDLAANYTLVNDINASETRQWNDGKGFSPVLNNIDSGDFYFNGTPFTGSFDGQGYTISNLYINRSSESHIGLFGYAGIGASITNLTLWNDVNGNEYVGGLVGRNMGILNNCYAIGNVTGDWKHIGGLVGWNSGTLESCYGKIDVTGGDIVGGLVGCNLGRIKNCYATGNVTGNWTVGGLVGFEGMDNGSSIWIENCYATGNVTGNRGIGGLVGSNSVVIVKNSFWDVVTSGQLNSNGGIGKTTIEMMIKSTFTVAGWDFEKIWDIINNQTYPFLRDMNNSGSNPENEGKIERFAGGDGSILEPFEITNIKQLQNMDDDLSAHYVIVNDIDASGTRNWNNGKGFEPIANEYMYWEPYGNPFMGSLDGGGYDIFGLYINRNSEYYVGLFGYLGEGGSVRDVHLENSNICGKFYVGGIVGNNRGVVDQCSVTGSVEGYEYVGSVVGCNYDMVKNCYAIGNVSGNRSIGGLLGTNAWLGTVSKCYATGDVTGVWNVSGLVGDNGGEVENSYATGNIVGDLKIGGLVGSNWKSTISKCYATGNVTGDESVGGLVGWNYDGTVLKCYATGNVAGGDEVGGLVGHNRDGTVSNCYAIGNVTGNIDVGGLVGNNRTGTILNCFWDIQTTGLSLSKGGIGMNTAEMKLRSTYTNAGWDFMSTWSINEYIEYPHLFWEKWPLQNVKDSDNDGVPDEYDDFPSDPAASKDSDKDGFPDRWNNGKSQTDSITELTIDKFPNDPAASKDSDDDGSPDEWNDGKFQADSITELIIDKFPNDPTASTDSDGDGFPDKWNDGIDESSLTTNLHRDAFPFDPSASIDTDGDGMPDEWNQGMNQSNSTSVPPLVLDPFPNNPDNEPSINNGVTADFSLSNWLFIILGVVCIFAIAILIIVIIRKKKDE